MNMQAILKQAQKMQKDLEKAEKELDNKEYTENISNGVNITMKGNMYLEKIEIAEDLLEKDNKEMLEDMIQVAMNNILTKIQDDKAALMKKMTGGVKMPGMF